MNLKTLLICFLAIAVLASYSCAPQDDGIPRISSSDCAPDTLTTAECQAPSPDSGAITGFHQNFFPGTTIVESEGHYTAGVPTPDSIFRFNYPNGSIKEVGAFLNQQRHGVWTKYGNLIGFPKIWTGTYTNCERTGTWIFYHTDGVSRKEEGLYENSVRKGEWNYYDTAGKLVTIVTYTC